MLRVVLTQLFLFSLPFLGYAIWLFVNKKAQTSENWRKGPLIWLVIGGFALAISGMVLLATFEVPPEGKIYRPSEFRDGEFIPGRYE